ncbi:MAG: pilus assembly protein [Anaerolineae bacterium]|nr:pilus assembly protein [Anaerolineae bacterium]
MEFALILPLLLMIIVGIFEFGRVLFIYSNLFNAVREGARYGITNPRDWNGIHQEALNLIALVDTTDVTFNLIVEYDNGPGTPRFGMDQLGNVIVGDRVVVTIQYEIVPITPLLTPIVEVFPLRTEAARTIQTLGTVVSTPPPTAPPTGSVTPPPPTATPTITPTATATPTMPPTATATPTTPPPATATPATPPPTTLPPTPTPIIITEPLNDGDTAVEGTAETGQMVTLRVVQTGYQTSVIVQSGTFLFSNLPPLVAGHTIIVEGYGQQDLAIVQGTPTTPPPTTAPPTAHFQVEPDCGPAGVNSLTVHAYNWPTGNYVTIFLNSTIIVPYFGKISDPDFSKTFTVDLTEGMHTLTMQAWTKKDQSGSLVAQYSQPVECPCPNPDLTITHLSLQNTAPFGTYERIKFEVALKNQGAKGIASVFWVDLYADTVPTYTNASVDYVAINGLPAGGSITFTMWIEEGFTVTGTHTLTALADTWGQIPESDEENNTSNTLDVYISSENPTPTPTPTPSGTPGAPATIQGTTYMDGVPQNNVSIYVYDIDGRLTWSGISHSQDIGGIIIDGYYEAILPAGDYTVSGQVRMANGLYVGQVAVMNLLPGEFRQLVDINLSKVN